jgi:multiple sugar transport system substrate-binding protein
MPFPTFSRLAANVLPRTTRRRVVAASLAALAAFSLAACSSVSSPTAESNTSAGSSAAASSGCTSGATPLTFWGWPAGYDLAVAQFNATHPKICVTLENAGASTAEYTKLSDALQAKSGTPDVATIEYFELPSFEITNNLVDLSAYGAASAQADEAPVAWSQVTQGSKIFAMPVDLGPLALYYNTKEFASNGLTVPSTWDEFATTADALHAKDPTAAITNFDPENAQAVLALMQEDNAFPFSYSGGENLGIHFTGASETAFANFWQKLIDAKEVTTAADFSPAQWANLDDGTNAARLSPAWGPVGMQLSIKNTIGDWQAAPLPQLQAGQQQSGNWGGSTLAVIDGTPHAAEAAEFVKWFAASNDSWSILSGPVAGAFPGYLPLLNSTTFQNTTLPISGSSTSNVVFSAAAQNMINPEWPPIMTAALTQWTSTFAGVTTGTETMAEAFASFQKSMETYAAAQGFTVSN